MKVDQLHVNDICQDEQGSRIIMSLHINGAEIEYLYARLNEEGFHIEERPCDVPEGSRYVYEGLSGQEKAELDAAVMAETIQYLLTRTNPCLEYTGHARKLDELGRIVLPFDLRKKLGLQEGDFLGIYTDKESESLILKKHAPSAPGCCMCGSTEQLKSKNGISICMNCLKEFSC